MSDLLTRRPYLLDLSERTPPLDWDEVFTVPRSRIEIEIGLGKGMFLRRRAAECRDAAFLGVERSRKWSAFAAERIARDALPNLRLVHGDAFDLLVRWIPLATLSAVHLLFPDPWPKKRHAKRRLLCPAFYDLSARVLAPGGILQIATDVVWYFEQATADLDRHAAFARREPSPQSGDGFSTHFALKYMKEGRSLSRALYRRTESPPPPIPPPPARRRRTGPDPRGEPPAC